MWWRFLRALRLHILGDSAFLQNWTKSQMKPKRAAGGPSKTKLIGSRHCIPIIGVEIADRESKGWI